MIKEMVMVVLLMIAILALLGYINERDQRIAQIDSIKTCEVRDHNAAVHLMPCTMLNDVLAEVKL